MTVGGFRTGALVARALPSFVAEGLGPADRVRRQLRQRRAAGDHRAPPAASQPDVGQLARARRPCRTPSTPTRATGSRACACRRSRRARSPPASTSSASPRSRRPSRGARGAILALPHLGGWEWAGRWLSDQGHRVTVIVERLEPPELFDWFVRLRNDLGMTVVPLGPGAGPRRAPGARRQRGRVPALRPGHPGRRRRGRVLRRAHHAAGRPGDTRPAVRRADPACRRVLHPPAQRPPRHRPPADPRRAPRQAPRGRHPGDAVPGPGAGVPHPPRPRAVAPVPAELASDPGYQEKRAL